MRSAFYCYSHYSRQAVGLQKTGTARKTVTVRTPVLAVARLAVDILVGTVACDDRVQRLGTVVTLEALAMPFATLGQDLLGSKDDATATRAALTGRRLDLSRIDDAGLRGEVTVAERED